MQGLQDGDEVLPQHCVINTHFFVLVSSHWVAPFLRDTQRGGVPCGHGHFSGPYEGVETFGAHHFCDFRTAFCAVIRQMVLPLLLSRMSWTVWTFRARWCRSLGFPSPNLLSYRKSLPINARLASCRTTRHVVPCTAFWDAFHSSPLLS